MSDEIESKQSTIALLHSEILRTGDDVRTLGVKVDNLHSEMRATIYALVQNQNSTNIIHTADIAGLKAKDDYQQNQLNELKTNTSQGTVNKLTVWAIAMGALAAFGTIAQAIDSYILH